MLLQCTHSIPCKLHEGVLTLILYLYKWMHILERQTDRQTNWNRKVGQKSQKSIINYSNHSFPWCQYLWVGCLSFHPAGKSIFFRFHHLDSSFPSGWSGKRQDSKFHPYFYRLKLYAKTKNTVSPFLRSSCICLDDETWKKDQMKWRQQFLSSAHSITFAYRKYSLFHIFLTLRNFVIYNSLKFKHLIEFSDFPIHDGKKWFHVFQLQCFVNFSRFVVLWWWWKNFLSRS